MEVKDIVKIAIENIADVFSSESPTNIGLEEVIFDEVASVWRVTVGFSRPWDYQAPGIIASMQPKHPNRQYKIVEVDDTTGKVKAIKIRE